MKRSPAAALALALLSLAPACAPRQPSGPRPSGPAPLAAPSTPLMAAAPVDEGCVLEGGLTLFSSADPQIGEPTAKVTVVIVADLGGKLVPPLLSSLVDVLEKEGTGRLRLVWKHAPGSESSRAAAEAAQGVFELGGQEAFWRFLADAIDEPRAHGRASFIRWAREAGVADVGAFERGLDGHAFARKVDADAALARRLEVGATPKVFVNGVEVVGAAPAEHLAKVVGEARQKAVGEPGAGASCSQARAAIAQHAQAPFTPPKGRNDDTTIWKVPVAGSPQQGPADALVTIVEFSDYQCPFCKRVEPTLAEIRARYGDRVRIVWKDNPLPFHTRAEPAAELAREALARKGQAGFWAAHDAIFASSPRLEEPDLREIAAKLGLDADAAMKAVTSRKHQRAIEADADLADEAKASGTPHFFINGRRLVGAQPLESFVAVIDEQLAAAEAMVASGTPRASIYETLMKGAKVGEPFERKQVAEAARGAPFRGSAQGRVVIQEFTDFQCPFCRRVEPTLDDLLRAYPGKIKIVFRHNPLPFHPEAELAAEASMEALAQKGQAGFWKMHKLLFEGQKAEGGLKRPALEDYARQAGLDVKRFGEALDAHKHLPAVQADMKAAEDAKINGTPSFVINGLFVSGAQPIGRFRRAVDLALAEAQGPRP